MINDDKHFFHVPVGYVYVFCGLFRFCVNLLTRLFVCVCVFSYMNYLLLELIVTWAI